MLKIVNAADLYRRPVLAASMFRDRAFQFKDRLRWEVSVDDMGMEYDQYDALDPVYVIVEDEAGEHLGSGRILPTTGRTMIAEHFSDLLGDTQLCSPRIWEITRFCVSPRVRSRKQALRIQSSLLWAGADLAKKSGVDFCLAVFNAPMIRIYKALGIAPEVLGSRDTPEGEICGGLWELSDELRAKFAENAGIVPGDAPEYFPCAERFPFAHGFKSGFGRVPEIIYDRAS